MALPSGLKRIEIPAYPHVLYHDIPTTGGRLPFFDNPEGKLYHPVAADAKPPTAAEVVNTFDYNAPLMPVPHIPANSCYRNATLAALFNLAPFVNFLENHDLPRVFVELRELSESFRNIHRDDHFPRMTLYFQRIATFWNRIGTLPDGSDGPWHTRMKVRGHRVDTTDKKAQQVTKEYSTEDCNELVIKNKQRVNEFATLEGTILEVSVVNMNSTLVPLSTAISQRMYDGGPSRQYPCVHCGVVKQRARFYKMVYLPEVLMVGVNYTEGLRTNLRNRANFPEYLDMSQFRDDPDGDDLSAPPGKADCLYRLEAVIGFPMQLPDQSGHYVSWVRRRDNQWTLLDDVGGPSGEGLAINQSWSAMNRHGNFRARLLMYVRNRDVDLNTLDARGLQIVSVPPQVTTGSIPTRGARSPVPPTNRDAKQTPSASRIPPTPPLSISRSPSVQPPVKPPSPLISPTVQSSVQLVRHSSGFATQNAPFGSLEAQLPTFGVSGTRNPPFGGFGTQNPAIGNPGARNPFHGGFGTQPTSGDYGAQPSPALPPAPAERGVQSYIRPHALEHDTTVWAMREESKWLLVERKQRQAAARAIARGKATERAQRNGTVTAAARKTTKANELGTTGPQRTTTSNNGGKTKTNSTVDVSRGKGGSSVTRNAGTTRVAKATVQAAAKASKDAKNAQLVGKYRAETQAKVNKVQNIVEKSRRWQALHPDMSQQAQAYAESSRLSISKGSGSLIKNSHERSGSRSSASPRPPIRGSGIGAAVLRGPVRLVPVGNTGHVGPLVTYRKDPTPTGSPRSPSPPRAPCSIHTDPHDPRIRKAAHWTKDRFVREFKLEGITAPRGNKPAKSFWLAKFKKHFVQKNRDYSIYTIERLRDAAREWQLEARPRAGHRLLDHKAYRNRLKRADRNRLHEYSQHGGPVSDDMHYPLPDADSDAASPSPPVTENRRKWFYDTDSDDGLPPPRGSSHAGKKSKNQQSRSNDELEDDAQDENGQDEYTQDDETEDENTKGDGIEDETTQDEEK
ncbi:hypothetical protein TruAng_000420 [Truncatella angustata]|nr:hypothetical protein TruAng_000420 [Truncatella angustata]